MRVHFIHAKEFWFRSHNPATKIREEKASMEKGIQNALIVFTSIEEGDPSRIEDLLNEFVSDLRNLVDSIKPDAIVIYPYAHLSSMLAPPSEAIRVLALLYERTRRELAGKVKHIIKAPFGWYKEFRLHCYGHPMSELSRTYNDRKEHTTEECFSMNKFIEKTSLKTVFKEVFSRWGYTRNTGIYVLHLNSMLGVIQSYNKDMLSLVTSKACSESMVLSQVTDSGSPFLVYGGRGLHFYVTLEENAVDFLSKIFELVNVEVQNNIISIDNKEIGKCADGRCAIGIEKTLAARLYIELEKAQQTNVTPVLECWLSPSNVYLASATGSQKENNYVKNLLIELAKNPNLRIYGDIRKVRLGKKLRDAGKLWSHFTVIIGEQDLRSNTLTIRKRLSGEQLSLTQEDFIDVIKKYSVKCGYGIGFYKLIE